jgi:hypothetical protein
MLIALGGCGGAGFEKSDGSIDRVSFRSSNVSACRIGMNLRSDAPSREETERLCGCVADRLLTHSDAELSAIIHNYPLRDRELQAATDLCLSGAAAGRPEPNLNPLIDASGAVPGRADPPAPPLGALSPPLGPAAEGRPPPPPDPYRAMLRNRSSQALSCGFNSEAPGRLVSGHDYDMSPGRAHCQAPVRPPVFDIAAGHIYDLVPDGSGGATARDVTLGR